MPVSVEISPENKEIVHAFRIHLPEDAYGRPRFAVQVQVRRQLEVFPPIAVPCIDLLRQVGEFLCRVDNVRMLFVPRHTHVKRLAASAPNHS